MNENQIMFIEATHKQTGEKVVFTDLDYLAIVGQYTINLWNDSSLKDEEMPNHNKDSQYNSEAIKYVLSLKGLNPDNYTVS